MRGNRIVLLVLLLAAPFAFAGGAVDIIVNPHTIATCGSQNVFDQMQDPSTTTTFSFLDTRGCEKLCKEGEKQCKKFVKRVTTCRQDFNDAQLEYDEATCEANFVGSDIRECKRDAKAERKDADANDKANRAAELEACESWGTDCENRCDDTV